MKFATSPPTYSLKSATTSEWSQTCNLSQETLARATLITQDGVRLDIAANGFWEGRYQRTFLDVRIFKPHAKSYCRTPLPACYRIHENTKKRAYEQRILEVEHASFTPLVFSASGGLSKEATYFYKRLASRLAEKRDQPYSCTMNWLRCLLSFSLLRSAIRCFRGARSSTARLSTPTPNNSCVPPTLSSVCNVFYFIILFYFCSFKICCIIHNIFYFIFLFFLVLLYFIIIIETNKNKQKNKNKIFKK